MKSKNGTSFLILILPLVLSAFICVYLRLK
jgi:hypothetical protein